ncbi:MAG TPA: hypothetical protein VIX73_18280, partial [Kofleriaceae bacterium]
MKALVASRAQRRPRFPRNVAETIFHGASARTVNVRRRCEHACTPTLTRSSRMRRALAASGRTHRVDQRSEHLAILARAMDLAERAHRMVEIGEPRLDVVEAAAAVQLGAQCVARIVDASRRAVLDVERAGMGTAERAACVGIGTRRRAEVSGPRAGAGERS